MTRERSRILVAVLMACAWATTAPEAQKGKKPPAPDIPGEAVIGCAGSASATTDGVCGDGSDLYVDQSLGGDAGVQVSLREGDNQFRLRFDPLGAPTRHLTAFIPARVAPPASYECDGNCVVADNTAIAIASRDGVDARIQTTMRDASGRTVEGGPRALAIGDSAPIDILIGFQDPNGNGSRWALYWSPVNYPGSTPATVTRTGVCTWQIEAAASDVVGLRLFDSGIETGSGRIRGHYEGRFSLPFSLTFTADPASMPGGC